MGWEPATTLRISEDGELGSANVDIGSSPCGRAECMMNLTTWPDFCEDMKSNLYMHIHLSAFRCFGFQASHVTIGGGKVLSDKKCRAASSGDEIIDFRKSITEFWLRFAS